MITTERLQIIIDALYEAGDELSRMRKDVDGVSDAEERNVRQTRSARDSFQSLAIVMGTVTAAAFTAKKAFDFTEQGAQIMRLEESGQRLADQFGQDMNRIVSSIQGASGGTIDAMTAMQAANNAMVLDVAKTPEEFERLTTAAVALGRATGRTAEQSIQDLTTGVGRQSRMILDNLGIVVEAEKDYANYAESIGKTAEQLTDAEKKQALLNKALEAAEPLLNENGELVEDQAAQYEKLSANWENYTQELKKRGARIVKPAINQAGSMITAYNDLDAALAKGIITQDEHARMTRRVKFHFEDLGGVTQFLTDREKELSLAGQTASKIMEDQAFATEFAKKQMVGATIPAEILARKMEGLGEVTREAERAASNFILPWEQSIDTFSSVSQRLQSIIFALERMQGFGVIEVPVNIPLTGEGAALAGKLFGGFGSNRGITVSGGGEVQPNFIGNRDYMLSEKVLTDLERLGE